MLIFIRTLSMVASLVLAGVTCLVFLSVTLRYLFNSPLPDTADLSRLGLGIAMMSGIALANAYGSHITMDTLWLGLGNRGRYLMDLVAQSITLVVMIVLAWVLFRRTLGVMASHEGTFDLSIPLWFFYGPTFIAALCAVVLTLARLGEVAVPRWKIIPRHD